MKGAFNQAGRITASMLVLSGLDGSGKSTQTALLAERLRAEGVRAQAVWNRWDPRISAPFIRTARKYLRARERVGDGDYRSFTEAKRRRMKSGWKRSLWQFMVWSEYALQVHGRLFLHLLRGTKVICDRYVYDTLIDIAINFSVPAEDLEELTNHPLLSFFPKPGLVIFIDIDPLVGAGRKSDGTPAAYLADRRAYYTAMARILRAPLVDGSAPVESVSRTIWELTREWRSCPGTAPVRERDQGKGT